MAPQGWGHVLRHPRQAGLGLKRRRRRSPLSGTGWLVDSKACGAGCCTGIKSRQGSHFTFKLRVKT